MLKTLLPKTRNAFNGIFGGGFRSNFETADDIQKPRRGEALYFDRFADELPYAQMDDSDRLCTLMAPDQRKFEGLGYVIEVTPQTGASKEMAKNLELLFGQGAPEGTGIQVTLFGSPYVNLHTDAIRRSCVAREDAGDREELMRSIASSRADFLEAMARGEIIVNRSRVCEQRCWISVVVPTDDPFDPEVREKVLNLRESHVSILSNWHLAPWVWNRQALVATVSQIVNPQRLSDGSWRPFVEDKDIEPRLQCVFRDTRIEVEPEAVVFSSSDSTSRIEAVSLSARNYANEIGLFQMNHLSGSPYGQGGYPCPYLVTTYANLGSYDRLKAKAELKSARAEQMAGTEIARFIPSMGEEARDWREAVRSFESGEGLLKLSHQVVLMPRAKEKRKAIEAAKTIFQKAGITLSVDDYMHLQGLMVALPMTGGPLLAHDVKLAQRCSTKTSANAANTIPLLGDWKGTGNRSGKGERTPVVTLVSRRGQLLFVDPFANPNGNYNGIVVGASGSGKSVMLNELALGMLRTGGRVWVIDIGRSYEKLCEVVGGQWIELSEEPRADGKRDCLNPFSLIRNIDEDMDLITPLLAQMVSPSKPLNDLELSHLQIHFKAVWEEAFHLGKTATITDLAHSLLHNGRLGGSNPRPYDMEWLSHYEALSPEEKAKTHDPRIQDLGVQLSPFCKGGAFASFFEGQANINFNNNFIVLELERLKTKKALQSVVLMLLMYLIDLEMRTADRSQSKLVIIDEAWDLMGEGHSGAFIEAGYRRARKLNGSFFTATQSLADYQKSPTAKAALENSDCKFLLRQNSESLQTAKKQGLIALDDAQITMLSSLTTRAGEFSEVLVRIGDEPPSINRLILDPYTQLLTSSHPDDVSAIGKERAAGRSVHEAISAVLAKRQKGEKRAL